MAPVTSKPKGYVKIKVQPQISKKRAKRKEAETSQKPKKLFKGNGLLKLYRFTVDCTLATDTSVIDINDLQRFLSEQIESEMDKTGDNIGNFVVVKVKKSKVTATSGPPFTESVFESLIKKYLKTNHVQFRVDLQGPNLYQLTKKGNTNVDDDEVDGK